MGRETNPVTLFSHKYSTIEGRKAILMCYTAIVGRQQKASVQLLLSCQRKIFLYITIKSKLPLLKTEYEA